MQPTKKIVGILFIASSLLMAVTACHKGGKNDQSLHTVDSKGGEKFETFYTKFLSDSLFQVSRIVFPLQGRGKFVDSTNYKEEYYYTPDAWVMHHAIDFEAHPEYKREFRDYGFMLQEIIDLPNDLFIERRWRQIDGKWHLVFYGDLNNHAK